MLYLLFNEGYLSAHAEQAIRRELCDEAIRLATLLAEHPVGAVPETFALLALMHLHAAGWGAHRRRWEACCSSRSRTGPSGIANGCGSGANGCSGPPAATCSRASTRKPASPPSIASRPRSQQTRWREIADLYAMLERIAPSPLHTMNRAVAVAEWQGPEAGLALLQGARAARLAGQSYLWDAVLGDLHRRAGHLEIAQRHRERALASAPTEAVRDLLRRRLAQPSRQE